MSPHTRCGSKPPALSPTDCCRKLPSDGCYSAGIIKRCQVREALDPILTRHSHALFICVHPRSSAVGYSGGDEAKRSSNTSDSIARTARNSSSAPVFLEASTQSVTHTGSHVAKFATFELFAAAFR